MNKETFKEYQRKADRMEIPDVLNPAFIFSLIPAQLVSQIAKGEIDAKELAKRELEARGLNINGKWEGWK